MRTGIQPVRVLTLCVSILMVAIMGSLWSPSAATAATYYVATTGSDSNPGTQSQPFRTISKGVSVVAAEDTLYIRGGTYSEGIDSRRMTIPSGTSWTNAPHIAAYSGETIIVRGVHLTASSIKYLIIDGIISDATGTGEEALYIGNGAHHVRIQNGALRNSSTQGAQITRSSGGFNELINLDVHNNGTDPHFEHGLYIWGSNNLVDGCRIYHNAAYGVHIYDSDVKAVNNNVVRNSKVYGNGSAGATSFGVLLSSGDGNMTYNNLIYNNRGGIKIGSSTTNTKVYNNTLYNNAQNGIEVTSSSTGAVIRNNIVYAPETIINRGTSTTLSHNLTSDPKFVKSSANDFHLQSTSPAIDAGMALTAVPVDFSGIPRPQGSGYDIGAYEYQANPLAAPANLRLVSP